MKKLFSGSIIVAMVFVGIGQPGVATSFPVISGTLKDVAGKPLENVAIYATSTGLVTDTCTNENGQFKVQAKSNQSVRIAIRGGTSSIPRNGVTYLQGCNEGSRQSWYIEGDTVISTGTSNLQLNLVTPKTRTLKINVLDDDSKPVYGASVMLNAPFVYAGSVSEGKMSNTYSGWWSGETAQNRVTDINGQATFGIFEVAQSMEEIDSYCNFRPEYCNEGDGVTNSSKYLKNNVHVSYNARPGVLQSDFATLDDALTTGEVIVPVVPDLKLTSPTSAKYLSMVSVTSTATISSALSGSSVKFSPASILSLASTKKSIFFGKRADFYSRNVSNPKKPGPWKKLTSCTYTSVGKCSIKFKLTATSEVQFRPVGFSSVLSTRKITKK